LKKSWNLFEGRKKDYSLKIDLMKVNLDRKRETSLFIGCQKPANLLTPFKQLIINKLKEKNLEEA